jgi:hypothetical protein
VLGQHDSIKHRVGQRAHILLLESLLLFTPLVPLIVGQILEHGMGHELGLGVKVIELGLMTGVKVITIFVRVLSNAVLVQEVLTEVGPVAQHLVAEITLGFA